MADTTQGEMAQSAGVDSAVNQTAPTGERLGTSGLLIILLSGAMGGMLGEAVFQYLDSSLVQGLPSILRYGLGPLGGGLGVGLGGYIARQERNRSLLPIALSVAALSVVLYLLLAPHDEQELIFLIASGLFVFLAAFSTIVGVALTVSELRRGKYMAALLALLLALIAVAGLAFGILFVQLYRNQQLATQHGNNAFKYFIAKDYDGAIVEYSTAIDLSPNDVSYHELRAEAYLAKGETDKAIADYAQTTRIKPDDSNLRFGHIDAYRELCNLYSQQHDYTNAVDSCNQAMKLITADQQETYLLSGVYTGRGDAEYGLGKYDTAIADYSQAIKNPGLPFDRPYYGRGLAYKAEGEKDKAIADFKQVVAMPNASPDLVQMAKQQLQGLGVSQG